MWKKKVPMVGIDLSEETHGPPVYLKDVNLSFSDLTDANLSGTDLQNTCPMLPWRTSHWLMPIW